jgi:hypothetical protein
MIRAEDFSTENGVTTLKADLAPGGSVFVVFTDDPRSGVDVISPVITDAEAELYGPWTVTFPEGWGAPSEITLDELVSWTDSEIEGVKYFSGTASYSKTIEISADQLDKGNDIMIDLGEMKDVAEVILNGQSAGILWKKPFTADITALVKPGENELTIEIVNMWVNRLTGDMLSEGGATYCRTNHPYVRQDNWAGGGDETYRLQTAGLLGPVRIIYTR